MATVYAIRFGDFVKIGFTRNVVGRICSLRTASPHTPEILMLREGRADEEKRVMEALSAWHHRREWFVYCPALERALEPFNEWPDEEITEVMAFVEEGRQ